MARAVRVNSCQCLSHQFGLSLAISIFLNGDRTVRIQTITSLSLTDSWRGVKTHEVVQRQGDLDGACGPYALMNALMLSRALTEPQVRQL